MRNVLVQDKAGEFRVGRRPTPVTKKEAVRRSAAIQHYMRERLITRGEAEQMYAEFGLYAPKRMK